MQAQLDRLARDLIARRPGAAHQAMLDAVEAVLIRAALAHTQGNQLRAAEVVGINRITLKKRMDELGIGK